MFRKKYLDKIDAMVSGLDGGSIQEHLTVEWARTQGKSCSRRISSRKKLQELHATNLATPVRLGSILAWLCTTNFRQRYARPHTEPWQWLGDTLCGDHRMARGVIDGVENEALPFLFVG